MIPRAYIDEWRATAPWSADAWVEQDLVISRALVEMFRAEAIADRLAFRGGTALYKLHVTPAARYSEDIDLVQIAPGAIGDTLDRLRSVLDPWLGAPPRRFKVGRVTLVYRFDTEAGPAVPMRLKVEINTREHCSVLAVRRRPFRVDSRWFSGDASVSTFAIDELLGTKLRALHQRKKGRDMFDLWWALERASVADDVVIRCFQQYMHEAGHAITRAQFEQNLAEKAQMPDFRGDIAPLLRPGTGWDFDHALRVVSKRLVNRLDGAAWKGAE